MRKRRTPSRRRRIDGIAVKEAASGKRKRKRTTPHSNDIPIPPYRLGDVLEKSGCEDVVLVEDHQRGSPHITMFRGVGIETKRVTRKFWKSTEIAVLGYTIKSHMDMENMRLLVADAIANGEAIRKHKRPPKPRPDHCQNGAYVPLEGCRIAKGPSPLDRGVKVSFKGRRVYVQVDEGEEPKRVRAVCPVCERKVPVVHLRKPQGFFLTRHKPKNKKNDWHRPKTSRKRKRVRTK